MCAPTAPSGAYKVFHGKNLAAGGIHFRRGIKIRARGPLKMPRHFEGTGTHPCLSSPGACQSSRYHSPCRHSFPVCAPTAPSGAYKVFHGKNLAAGGIHFRRGIKIRARGPRKMLRHFQGMGTHPCLSSPGACQSSRYRLPFTRPPPCRWPAKRPAWPR